VPAKVYFAKAGEGSFADWEVYFKDQYSSTVNKGYVSLPTGSHDAPRMANDTRNDSTELKVLLTFILTQPGVPLIYYGDEIGMRFITGSPDVEGSKTRSGTRTPMQWDGSENAGFSTAAKEKMYIPLDADPNRPTVARQDKNQNSQLNYVRTLLKLRASSAALSNDGGLTFLSDTARPYPMVYMRQSGNEKYIIAINPSDKNVETTIAAQNSKVTYTFGTNKNSSYKAGKEADVIKLPAVSAAVFKVE